MTATAGPKHRAETLVNAAVEILNTADPFEKAGLTDVYAAAWRAGELPAFCPDGTDAQAPAKPARDNRVEVVPSGKTVKLGKGGSLASRQAIIHSLTHIESWAVDLSWDIIARFGGARRMPRAFFDDFVLVAEEEAKPEALDFSEPSGAPRTVLTARGYAEARGAARRQHFTLLNKRLEELGSHYGALPAHDGLWESATESAASLEARLAVEHCVHEARGLDVVPQTIQRLRSGGDATSADLLNNVIYPEEITHCAAGLRWFKWLHEGQEHAAIVQSFHDIVRKHFRGPLKPPFNEEARAKAGFDTEWYLPLATKPMAVGKVEASNASAKCVEPDADSRQC